MKTEGKILRPRRLLVVLGLLVLLLIVLMAMSIAFGGPSVQMVDALLQGDLSPRQQNLLKVRTIRVIIGAITGGALGACGVILQALFA